MSTIASFQLTNYLFNKIELNFENQTPKDVNVNFDVSGIYKPQQNQYDLNLTFTAFPAEDRDDIFITINCIGIFTLENVNSIDEVPPYFYTNAIAILFPYIRSSVSILSIQANIPALVLPTYNLTDLEKPLRTNTTVK